MHHPQPHCTQSCKCQGGNVFDVLCTNRIRKPDTNEVNVVEALRKELDKYTREMRLKLQLPAPRAEGKCALPLRLASPP